MTTANPHDPAWLETQYNNRARVPAHAAHFERWVDASAAARVSLACVLDVAYGSAPGERLDVFAAAAAPPLPLMGAPASTLRGAPVLVFLHGGYWRSLDKADHSFVAVPFVRGGVCVVVPNYTLCPAITVPGIVDEVQRALDWTRQHIGDHGGNPERITLVGHSAGGHLAAALLARPLSGARNALSISGLFDLEPLRHAPFLQRDLRLSAEDARAASPVHAAPPGAGVLHCVVGGLESAEFVRQNTLLEAAWGSDKVPVCEALPGLDHFTVLDALADPAHGLHRQALDLLHR